MRVASDPFDASRMPFVDHLEELRYRLWRGVAGFGMCLLLVFLLDFLGHATGLPFGVGRPVFNLLTVPVKAELGRYHERRAAELRRQLILGNSRTLAVNADRDVPVRVDPRVVMDTVAHALGRDIPLGESGGAAEYVTLPVRIPPVLWVLALEEAHRMLHRPPALKVMGAAEGMFVYLKVALLCGAVLGMPWLFCQLWAFVAAGLYASEKRLVHFYMPISLTLFFGGVAVCLVWVMPKTVEALLSFDEWLGVEPDLRLNEWLNFALLMPLVFGVAFQTPLVMWCLDRLGVVDAVAFRRQRRAAWFVLAMGAAVLTPGIDIYSMLFLWLPLIALYEAGIWLCRLSRRNVCNWEGGSLS